jgi:PAS domain-containing protein
LENVIDGVVITFNDSSESMTLERELKESRNELKEVKNELKGSTHMLSTLIEQLDAGVVAVNRGLTVTLINGQAERLLGRDRAELEGKNLFEAFPDGATLDHKLVDALRRRTALSFETALGGLAGTYKVQLHPDPVSEGLLLTFAPVTDQR